MWMQAAVQKARGDQAPPLAHLKRFAEFRAEFEERAAVNAHQRIGVALAHAVQHGRREQAEVDEQNDGGGEAGVRDETSQNFLRLAPIDRARPHLGGAVGTDTITGGDESPAVRAHTALIHGQLHCSERPGPVRNDLK